METPAIAARFFRQVWTTIRGAILKNVVAHSAFKASVFEMLGDLPNYSLLQRLTPPGDPLFLSPPNLFTSFGEGLAMASLAYPWLGLPFSFPNLE